MPLVVPALRLAMLFLNIYDTYKFLKPPIPSSRNANKPSLRTVTQRKRNMKGCLAVWIVWCCYIVYERLLEPLVSIFIPFYDELKSLVIIFLILTRARGAEPVYLHIIRPFLKPYTETLDSILDFTFLVLDIVLAALSAPVIAARALWNRTFGRGDSESDKDETPLEQPNGCASSRDMSSGIGSHVPQPANGIYEADFSGSAQIDSPAYCQPISPDLRHKHEIWHPPPSPYLDEEDDNGLAQLEHQRTSTSDSDVTLIQEVQIDEWRQYPKCPAAYPPTPLVAMMHVTAKTVNLDAGVHSSLPDVDELSAQDFRQSLSPLSKAIDPDSDGNLSDEERKRRVNMVSAEDDRAMFVDTDTESNTMGEEEEDEFNITLQTPFPTRQFANAFFQPVGISSHITSLAMTGSHSQSTGATTAYNGPSLRPKSSLDSMSSAMVSDEESPMIGRKRPLPISRSNSNKDVTVQGLGLDKKQRGVGDEIKRNRQAPFTHSSDNQKHRDDGSKTAELKKRKLGSPKRPVRTSRPIRSRFARAVSPPVRPERKAFAEPRLARAVSPPARPERKAFAEQGKPLSQRHERVGFAPRASRAVASSTNNVASSARATENKPRPGPAAIYRGHES